MTFLKLNSPLNKHEAVRSPFTFDLFRAWTIIHKGQCPLLFRCFAFRTAKHACVKTSNTCTVNPRSYITQLALITATAHPWIWGNLKGPNHPRCLYIMLINTSQLPRCNMHVTSSSLTLRGGDPHVITISVAFYECFIF